MRLAGAKQDDQERCDIFRAQKNGNPIWLLFG
jgi:hypothetical protein